MTTKSNFKLSMAAIASSLLVAACGGGGGDSGSNSGSAPVGASQPGSTSTVSIIAPQTSVPAPTYAAATGQYSMFASINAYRSQVGVGMVSQDLMLDSAAQNHSLYEQVNYNSGAETSLSHTENSANPDYYEAWPYLRARKSGTAANLWVGEVVAAGYSPDKSNANDGARCVQQWINTVYHLQGITSNTTSVGLGYLAPVSQAKALSFCVADFGVVAGVAPATENDYNAINYNGGQQISVGAIVHAPYSNETNVAVAMQVETPNPAPDLTSPGRPIMVRVNNQTGNVLTVDSFQVKDAAGNAVAARIIVEPAAVGGSKATVTADVNNHLSHGVAFLLPLAPLAANTAYTVSFSGARDGAAVNTSWQFTTAGN
jgi:uncharacterized protein YkwD